MDQQPYLLVRRFFAPALRSASESDTSNTGVYGLVVEQSTLVSLGSFAAPHSYTGEDTVEISCHGSMVVLESVVEEALSLGAVAAAPGEFTRRAFLNGRLDLLEAEAVIDLIQASSKAHLDNAYGLASGRLSKMVKELKNQLVKMLSLLEIGLDFSDEDIDSIGRQEIQTALREVIESSLRLAETFEGTRRRQEGYLVVLIGRPNVGKSTLLNVLLGEDRAISHSLTRNDARLSRRSDYVGRRDDPASRYGWGSGKAIT